MRWLRSLSLNQKLDALAVALGAFAVFANVAPGHTVTLDAKERLAVACDRIHEHDDVPSG